jgi:type IX secretion system PorP/SprF family membrane protein
MLNVASEGLQNVQPNDPAFMNLQNQINPNVGFGIYYHNPHFFLGLSSPRILENSSTNANSYLENRHYFGIIGGVFSVAKSLKMRPSVQVKATMGAPISVDASLAGIVSDKLWIGGMYRLNSSAGGFVQYQISRQFRLGVGADFGTNGLRNANSGSYELLISYDFNYKKSDVKSPRYF